MKKLSILLITILCLLGCNGVKDNESEPKKVNEMANTTWIASDGSEMIFGEKEMNWYKDEGVHDDNYYTGTYEYYRGKDAVKFITTELSEYGVTEEELDRLFEKNSEQTEENFVVFNLVYSGIVIGGETTVPPRPLVPWYGFILNDGTYLDVVNMNTATYYAFTKK